jgi:hypothetical protein
MTVLFGGDGAVEMTVQKSPPSFATAGFFEVE